MSEEVCTEYMNSQKMEGGKAESVNGCCILVDIGYIMVIDGCMHRVRLQNLEMLLHLKLLHLKEVNVFKIIAAGAEQNHCRKFLR